MKLNSIRVKLILSFGTGIILLLGTLTSIFYMNFREIFKKQISQKGEQISEFFRNHSSVNYGFLQEDKVLLGEVVNLFMRNEDVIFAGAVKSNGEMITFKTKDEKIAQDLVWFIKNIITPKDSKIITNSQSQRIVSKKTITGEEVIIFLNPVMIQKQELPILEGGGTEGKEIKGFTALAVTMKNFDNEFRNVILRIGALALSLTGILSIIFIVIINNIISPVNKVKEVAEKIANQMDLTQKPYAESNDEIGELSDSFSKMVDILKTELKEIKTASEIFSKAAKDIAKMSDRIKQGIETQEKESEKISDVIENIYEIAGDVLNSLADLLSLSKKIKQDEENREKKITEIKSQIDRIIKDSEDIYSSIGNVVKNLKIMPESASLSTESAKVDDSRGKIENKISSTLEKLKKSEESIIIISESGENIQNQIGELIDSISKITSGKNATTSIIQNISQNIEKLVYVTYELLDFIDDMNILSVNAHIAISHEDKGEDTKREFKIIAGAIKELSKNAEEKIKNIRSEIKEIQSLLVKIMEVTKNETEPSISNLDKIKSHIESSTMKIKGNSEELKSEFRDIQTELNETLTYFQETFMNFKFIIQTVMKIYEALKNSSGEISESFNNLNLLIKNISYVQNLISDEIDDTKVLIPAISELNNIVEKTSQKVKEEYKGVEETKKSLSEVTSSIEEIKQITIILKTRADNILKVAQQLGEMTQQFKLS
jgi:methyl-accepting chemotaxis protein